jgi:hypothetical protein
MPQPTFIVIGVGKAGTTSIYEYAAQHPDIHMSPTKETNSFAAYGQPLAHTGPGDDTLVNRTSIHRWEDYQAQFSGAPAGAVCGEASPRYMWDPRVPKRMHRDLPDVRLVLALRHPVDRAYAAWVWSRMSARETEPFEVAIELDAERFEAGWGWGIYRRVSRYADQLERYYAHFDREQIHVHLFEDFARDPITVMRRIFDHVGADPTFVPDTHATHFGSGIIQNRVFRTMWESSVGIRTRLRPLWPARLRHAAYRFVTRSARKPELDPDLRRRLTREFRDDIERTASLTGLDLAHWLE